MRGKADKVKCEMINVRSSPLSFHLSQIRKIIVDMHW